VPPRERSSTAAPPPGQRTLHDLVPSAKQKNKFYAVATGREGPKIYRSWESTKQNVDNYPGNRHQGFATLLLAQAWLRTKGVNTTVTVEP
jgi:viroplasmin and RNaseH domain-containing protein